MNKFLSFILFIFFLTSCSFLGPIKRDTVQTYELNSVPYNIPKKSKRPIAILVMQPDTVAAFDTSQMAYQVLSYQVAFFAQNKWIERPGIMLQPLIVQALQKTGHFRAVVVPPTMGRYDYILTTQILQLQQDYRFRPGLLRFRVRVQLINFRTNSIMSTYEFKYVKPIVPASPYNGVLAANQATRQLLKDIARFCLKNT